ncbi:MAG: PTS mannose/fructose/sorbose/N-acetylgalactosamine transporter subunit IIC [Lactobacillus panisapium]|uniref:PTS mannose/fructose/sorbose/N-acetylgalactosamine transporter subunit IIC n=1 Tax=Lactobacillus panisapium TaxID=2012495 RepID=UPI001C69DF05|nr:PTS sugar transporter subunit IIC [Lactobacillus panisapium]MCO6547993.1 PTS sugar transporter subunit IIC [Gilliamella sp.]QYN59209.1 PTS sugar transporter subunit IIC [Lactobacillus panisapium]
MEISIALLATLAYFLANAIDRCMGWQTFERPIVAGTLTGILLGDPKTGILMGAALEAIFMGMSPIGGAIPADPFPTAVICVAYTIATGSKMSVAIGLSIPIGALMQTVKTLYAPVLASMSAYWEKLAKTGNVKKFRRLSILQSIFGDRLPIFIVLFLSIAFGTKGLQSLFAMLPDWVMRGFTAGAGMMTAIGFAILVNMIWNNQIGIFLIFGFVLAKYLKLSALPIAIIVGTIAMIYFIVMNYVITHDNEVNQSSIDENKSSDEEDFF